MNRYTVEGFLVATGFISIALSAGSVIIPMPVELRKVFLYMDYASIFFFLVGILVYAPIYINSLIKNERNR